MSTSCAHLRDAADRAPEPSRADGCEDCLAAGEHAWAHLRMCTECGHVGCCDSSPHRHATAHYHETAHPVVRSFEPGESWTWCYVDEKLRA
ncbi:ubiquitin-hydrolase Zn-finger-containing protein [Saccharopolyspora kobensis]|uniref:Ubiquitin-hydrolase Zn-finger-containing protein n=1 Tax=Saccharopolyspora kobensis TaxID=146035 RepID=A0A1H6C9H7_9PSEU|nr:UBP-type zinc finger domain-containing protein [Saccharopolyspora kobensis]SEG69026.1 ubiquitin-hydrolase Zn-finger-containing protein [Saccharopolyspora kobensis]SFC31531.1 ubiquitin-hydrolase Zn-finger-containing protein [Saccharopolyspora kobensis]